MRDRTAQLGGGVSPVQLGQAVVERLGRGEEPAHQTLRDRVRPDGGQPEQRDRGVVRPHRSTVVRQGRVTFVQCGHRTHAEAGRERRCGQQLGHPRLLARVQQAGAEQVPDVAGQRVDRPAFPVDGERRERAQRTVHPEPVPEPVGQLSRVRPPSLPLARRAVERVEHRRRVEGGPVCVRLHLAERDRWPPQSPVAEPDRVERVLPALVGQPPAVGVDVLEEPVPVGIAVEFQPGQGPAQVRQQVNDDRLGHAPAPGVREQADPEQGGVDRAVVRRGKVAPPTRRGAGKAGVVVAQLVHDLPRRLAGAWVHSGPLAAGERPQRALGEPGAQRKQHPGRPDAVPAEEGEEPRRARAHERAVGAGPGLGQPQAFQVV
jgi:hypothetical protein